MKEIKKHKNTVRILTMVLFSMLFMFFYSSCTSISPKYLTQIADRDSVSSVRLKELYIFDNFPQKIPGWNDGNWEKNMAYNKYCLWNYIEPNYYKIDSLQYLYKISLQLTKRNKIHFKLIDTVGNVVREKTRKVKPELKNFVSFRNTDVDIYVLVNRFLTETVCFALDKNGDLVVPNEYTGGGFLVLFPFAGAQENEVSTYRCMDHGSY
ncbi:hypothetical protein [Sphingobacterium sp. WOUb80]|uniref:hypothetical protein n=1 Tax=Sphingobacterium sp. WOUb80 TaxID=3234028 RepID=UPI003CF04465